MPQRTYLVFGDIEGKLDLLRVECTKCARKGRYSVRRLIEARLRAEPEVYVKYPDGRWGLRDQYKLRPS